MPDYLLHTLWSKDDGGMQLWLEKTHGHVIVVPDDVPSGVLPPALDRIVRRLRFVHQTQIDLFTPKGKPVRLKVPMARPGGDVATDLLSELIACLDDERRPTDATVLRVGAASARTAATIASDTRWFVHFYRAIQEFVKAGYFLPSFTHSDQGFGVDEFYGFWRIGQEARIRSYLHRLDGAMPGVIRTNGYRQMIDDIADFFTDLAVRDRLGDLSGTRIFESTVPTTQTLLRGEPLRCANPWRVIEEFTQWRSALSSRELEVLVAIEPFSSEVLGTLATCDDTYQQLHFAVRLYRKRPGDIPEVIRLSDLTATETGVIDTQVRKITQVAPTLAKGAQLERGIESAVYGAKTSTIPLAVNPRALAALSHYPVLSELAARTGDLDVLLSTEQLALFLDEDVPRLRAAGITVLVPKGWVSGKPRASVHVGDRVDTSKKEMALDQLVQFQWRCAIGDTELSDDDLRELLASSRGLVAAKDRWINADKATVDQLRNDLAMLVGGRAQELLEELKRYEAEVRRIDSELPGASAARRNKLNVQRQELLILWERTAKELALEIVGLPDDEQEAQKRLLSASVGSLRQLVLSQAAVGESGGSLIEVTVDSEDDAPDDVLGDEGLVRSLIDGSVSIAPQEAPIPDTIHATLRAYQKNGVDWLYSMSKLGLGAVLADDMGLGKTLQVITLLAAEKAEGVSTGPTLVVAPTSVLRNWAAEISKFYPTASFYLHHGPKRSQGDDLARAVHDTDVCITSYGLLTRDQDDLAEVAWDHVVIDEAQYIKNPQTEAARAARRMKARHRIALTGTPVENRLAELRAILDFCNPGILGSSRFFRQHFARPIEAHNDQVKMESLRRLTAPLFIRRVKTDKTIAPDLPAKSESILKVKLTEEQAALYQGLVDEIEVRLNNRNYQSPHSEIGRRGMVLAALTKLKQICNHPAHFLQDGTGILDSMGRHRSGKVEALEQILEQSIRAGEKALVFTQYAYFGEMLKEYLSQKYERDIPFLSGKIMANRRQEMIESFQSEGGSPVMILSLKAGGTGVNLTAATRVIHMDRWWNPAVENQATDRAYRIGQTRDVDVIKMLSEGTLEHNVHNVIEGKIELVNNVLSEGEGWITELEDEELLSLMRYRDSSATPGERKWDDDEE